ncbi:hypothetical protein JX266_007515 [Neoarthrinium moseri]|nr:hypothetical protein JX266_007515 [Neoarthrinium moseri]
MRAPCLPLTPSLLREPAALPQMRRVTQLRMFPSHTSSADIPYQNMRPVSFRVPLELVTRLPAVRELDCPWTAVHQLHEQFPASLTKARLWFWKPDDFYVDENQGCHLPDLIRPAEADPLSPGLRTVASHLEDLDLRAIVPPDLFRTPVV